VLLAVAGLLVGACGPNEEPGDASEIEISIGSGETTPTESADADADAGDIGEAPMGPVDEWTETERTVPEIPDAWRRLGVTEELIAPWLSREQAPDVFRVKFETTKGDIVVECVRDWSPRGVDRFYNLVRIGYYTNVAFFRVIAGYIAQFGLHGNPVITDAWLSAPISDEPVKQSNVRGYLSFAKPPTPHSRSAQLFFNLADNARLDALGFSPFARVVSGLSVLDRIYSGEGEQVPQGQLIQMGNLYLKSSYPDLDYVRRAVLVE
jgi:peptidyl-prolyl cis-trans isomerase A (cyclophilin A)